MLGLGPVRNSSHPSFSASKTPAAPTTMPLCHNRAVTDDFLGQAEVDLRAVSNGDVTVRLKPQEGRPEQAYVKGSVALTIETPEAAGGRALISGEAVSLMKQRIRVCIERRDPALDLSTCQLPGVPKIVAEQCSFITQLDLGFNRIAALPDLSAFAATLEVLELSGNQLVELPNAIGVAVKLRILSLNGNALTTLSPAIGKLGALEKLELANNSISALPKEIGRLWNLEELHLSGNPLTTLPPSIGALGNLQVLDLSCCRLESLPDELTLAARVMDLNLGNNNLRKLPEGMGRMTRLVTLNLQDNNITDLPLSIGLCSALGQIGYGINIARNPIQDAVMLERYAVGTDQLHDYLVKRYTLNNSPPLPPIPMPRDLGEGPPPPWLAKELEKERERERIAQQQQQQQQSTTLLQKVAALKQWGTNAVKDQLRPRLAQLRNDTRAATTLAGLLDVCYRVKDARNELEKVHNVAPFEVAGPRDLDPAMPQIETLRAYTMAALNYVDNGIRAVQGALSSTSTTTDMTTVVLLVQVLNTIKTSLR